MNTIRLIRTVARSGRSGPTNGQYALQKALRPQAPSWLRLGGRLRDGEIPWFWSWADGDAAAACAATGRPFVAGPNILFADSRRPCRIPYERAVCHAASCRLLFTESAWYRDLIETQRGPANRAPIVVWPYPIDPKPGGPLTEKYDLLVYVKATGYDDLIAGLAEQVNHVHVLRYGRFRRQELHFAARRSRCCLYLSTDDRGPLALAEILLAGCPTIGVPRGAPFVVPGRMGLLLQHFRFKSCLNAILACHGLDRREVAARAGEFFNTDRIVSIVLESLRSVAED